jgi:hypothetical protein
LWVFHHDDSAVFIVVPPRGKKVVEDFLADFRPGFWVPDRYGGPMGWAKKDNQVCFPSAGYSIRLCRTQPLAGSAHLIGGAGNGRESGESTSDDANISPVVFPSVLRVHK